ncbi:MAG: DUF4954 family protein [Bacteroidales bacterium]|jgi:NDP-sugar pyrophosphorylase family protein|nr:DUF4954 family protein [Bacteroidales bacterium]
MKKQKYRHLRVSEISSLKANGCESDDWSEVYVTGAFSPSGFMHDCFSGKIFLGEQGGSFELPGGIKKKCGVYDTHLHNCVVGNNVLINHVGNYIANYEIEDNVLIDHVGVCVVDGKCTFGNGTRVNVLDETGGRSVAMYDHLSSSLAYVMTFYRHRPSVIKIIESLIDEYADKVASSTGIIGENSKIVNCRKILNTKIGPDTLVESACLLENCSINGNCHAPVKIGAEVILKNSIVSSGSEISDGAIVSNCFVGQGCILSSQFSAENSLFFANCMGYHGEACSIFAGPYTVSHHKSNLLIAGMFSFCNAGSGSNQSNHMYKLGPIHQGIVERGAKTASDSYILWPAKIGAFTLVMGRHYKNSDTSDIPFSYLIENDDKSWLYPAVNLRSIGTIRDAVKWPKRDRRTDPCRMDCVNFNLLSPYTIQKMFRAIKILRHLQITSGETTDVYSYNNTQIKRSSIERGIEIYKLAIMKFIGNSFISRLEKCDMSSAEAILKGLKPTDTTGKGDWLDLSGLIAPKKELVRMLNEIKDKKIKDLQGIELFFYKLHADYYENEWTWTYDFIKSYMKKSITDFSIKEMEELIEKWYDSVFQIDKMLYEDAKKEFRLDAMTGFGIDGGQSIKQRDFTQVRGRFTDNVFVKELSNHVKRKKKLENKMLDTLGNIQEQ